VNDLQQSAKPEDNII